MQIELLQKNKFSNFLVIKSRIKPLNKVIVFKNKEDLYLYSQNCVCFKFFSQNFILTPLKGIESVLGAEKKIVDVAELKDGLNPLTEDVGEITNSTFYLGYDSKVSLAYLLKDSKLVEFYHNYYRDGYQSTIK